MTDYIFFLFFLMGGILNNIHCKENIKRKNFITSIFYLFALIFAIRINIILGLLFLVYILNPLTNNHLNVLKKNELFNKQNNSVLEDTKNDFFFNNNPVKISINDMCSLSDSIRRPTASNTMPKIKNIKISEPLPNNNFNNETYESI